MKALLAAPLIIFGGAILIALVIIFAIPVFCVYRFGAWLFEDDLA